MIQKPEPLGTTEVIGAAWHAVAEEMGRAMIRTAISPNVKERRDCSAAVFSRKGELLAQAHHIPVHLSSLLDFARFLAHKADLKEGDVFACNDPYLGGAAHLSDIGVMTGVFYQGSLVGLVGTIAHHPDVGGRSPGSETADSTEIYQEGLRIPPVQLCRRWRPVSDTWSLITTNSRLGTTIEADLRSQVAAGRVGVARELELLERYGADTMEKAAVAWLDYAERRFRRSCAALVQRLAVQQGHRDSVRVTFHGQLDDDGRGGLGANLAGQLEIREDCVLVDLNGCDPQVLGALNSPLGATKAAVYYALKSALDPGVPSNEGYFRAVQFLSRPGSIVDPIPPAATGHRIAACQKLADAILRAFAEAGVDAGSAGSHGASLVILSGESATGRFVDYESFAGGHGGSALGHGEAGMMSYTTNSSNLPIEVMEREYPFVVRLYSLRAGSGGSGLHRGGNGVVREIEVLVDGVQLTTGLMDAKVAPQGVCGGSDGLPARCVVKRARSTKWHEIPPHTSHYPIARGDLLRVESAGGGGWGFESGPAGQFVTGSVKRRDRLDSESATPSRQGG